MWHSLKNKMKNEGGRNMDKMNNELGLVQAKQIAEEVYAMIEVCFECKTELNENKIQLILPTGEAFCLEISRVGL